MTEPHSMTWPRRQSHRSGSRLDRHLSSGAVAARTCVAAPAGMVLSGIAPLLTWTWNMAISSSVRCRPRSV